MRKWNVSAEAQELHEDALVWDMTLPVITPGKQELKTDLFARVADAGVDYQSITRAVDGMDFRAAGHQVALYRDFIAKRSDTVALVKSTSDLVEARNAGKLAIGFHFQGTAPFEQELGFVDVFYELGVRHALMAYNEENLVGFGCHVAEDQGLTSFGRDLIAEMNRIGMIVDCAHTGYRTAMEAMEASTSPVIVSHTNVHEIGKHSRCVRDDQIEACARTGGVVGITGFGSFMGPKGATPAALVDRMCSTNPMFRFGMT